MMNIVTPALRKWLTNSIKKAYGSLQSFLNSQPIKHLLFHLRHRNTYCCTDRKQCRNTQTTCTPLNNHQWDLLYAENPGNHKCHCNFKAKPIHVEDLDITLATLILINCCNLSTTEEHLIKTIRQFKNENLSHNTSISITEEGYKIIFTKLTSFVLQLDKSKTAELARIENELLEKWEEPVFYLTEQHELLSHSCLPPNSRKRNTSILEARAVMMDDETIILCSDHTLMILTVDKTAGTQHDKMAFEDELIEITMLTSCTVAILLPKCIKTIDVYLKQLITTIPVPETCKHIKNNSYNHLVVASYFRTFIVDPWTPQIVRTIGRDPYHEYLHAFDNRIYYNDYENCLHCFYFSVELQQSGTRQEEYPGEVVFKKKLPSSPKTATTLQDGSLYLVCTDGSVLHISREGRYFRIIETEGLTRDCLRIHYNQTQQKLISFHPGVVKIFQKL